MTKSCLKQPFFYFPHPFNLRYALRRDPTPIPTFSLASRNKIQNAFLSCQHASNYLICMQVKGQAVSVDFRICIDPSSCQNEEDDGSVPATKKKSGVFKSKNLKKIFTFECVKRVQLQGCLLLDLTLVPLTAQMYFENNKQEGKAVQMHG